MLDVLHEPISRPFTPDSLMTGNSLDHATTTIDELTLALSNFSRVPSPEIISVLTCCCGKDDCENLKAWLEKKSRLETRLTLSAEVGQALLHKHEAYVRQQERALVQEDSATDDGYSTQDDSDTKISELLLKNAALERRLTQALANNEVTEVSNKTILQELQEAKTTISRLSAYHARTVGWDNRLTAAMKERDDMQQERDFESHRARLAESRFAALKEKTSKLQADVRRLQDELQQKRMHQLESSESTIQDARSQIQVLHSVPVEETAELTKVLESLVDDNVALKHANEELQQFLADSREELRALQEEVEEQRASRPSVPPTPSSFRHHHPYSGSISSIRDYSYPFSKRGLEGKTHQTRPSTASSLTADTNTSLRPHSPFSPVDSDSGQSYPIPRSPLKIEFNEDGQADATPTSPEKPRTHKPLLLLTRSRGVQTDEQSVVPETGGLVPPFPSRSHTSTPSPIDPRSESSSFSETLLSSGTSPMALLMSQISSLYTRMSQADALTLTNRLKRQHLLHGADISYVSRSTVNAVLSDLSLLRTSSAYPFRAFLEDEQKVMGCNRKELRALLKLFRDIFGEWGVLRVIVNDVALDPSIAGRVREGVMDPSKATLLIPESEHSHPSEGKESGGWMAPLAKLFGSGSSPVGGSSTTPTPERAGGLMRSTSTTIPRPTKLVPKLQPALSASATTVNVEFSGRAVTSMTTATVPIITSPPPIAHSVSHSSQDSSMSHGSVMGIFAGAPIPRPSPDPWIVLPKTSSMRIPGDGAVRNASVAVVNPRTQVLVEQRKQNRLSRNVDAVIDIANHPEEGGEGEDGERGEEDDSVGPLLQRTLRRRGLSDSSIHSTFVEDGERGPRVDVDAPQESYRSSMLRSLSRKVQNFRLMGSSSSSAAPLTSSSSSSTLDASRDTASIHSQQSASRKPAASGATGFNTLLPSWGGDTPPDPMAEPFVVGSPNESSFFERARRSEHGYRTKNFY